MPVNCHNCARHVATIIELRKELVAARAVLVPPPERVLGDRPADGSPELRRLQQALKIDGQTELQKLTTKLGGKIRYPSAAALLQIRREEKE